MCDGKPKLNYVLYVAGLKANLLSISQLCDKELNVNFTKQICTVSNKSSEVMITGNETADNCYGIPYQGDKYATDLLLITRVYGIKDQETLIFQELK